MMIIKLPSGKVGVTFRHRPFEKPKFDETTCDKFMNGITDCEVYRLTETPVMDAVLIAHGIGICKFPDAFCKAIGRKASLTSALRKKWGPNRLLGFTRDERIAIWEEYWRYIAPQENPFRAPITDLGVNNADLTLPVAIPITEALVGPISLP